MAEDMRLYTVALVTWTAIVTTSSESNVANFSDEKAVVGYTEFPDSPVKQIVQPYVMHSEEERSSGRVEDRFDDITHGSAAELSRSVARASGQNGGGVSPIEPASLEESDYATFAETPDGYPSQEWPGYLIPEDVLVVESAGAFGQKVRQGPPDGRATAGRGLFRSNDGREDNEYVSVQKSISSTVTPFGEEEDNQRETHLPTTRKSSPVLVSREPSDFLDNSPSDDLKTIDLPARDLDGNSRPGNSTERILSTSDASVLENDVVPEYLPKPQARLTRTHNTTEDTSKKAGAVSTEKSVEIKPSIQLTKFSGPIVVPDLPAQELQDALVDYVDESSSSDAFTPLEDVGGSEANVRNAKTATPHGITASSLMLNPLQVGITLVNAIEAGGLTDDSELSAATETKDYFRDDLQQHSASEEQPVAKHRDHPDVGYKDVQQDQRATEVVAQKTPGNTVEIQKSIELYHTAPVHEIHYPVEYIQQTTHLGVIETNSIGSAQRSKQPNNHQDERSRLNYDAYRGNDVAEKTSAVDKGRAASVQKFNRQEYNVLEDEVGKPTASALIAEYSSSAHEQVSGEGPLVGQPLRSNEASLLLLANQFDDALYEQSRHHSLTDNDAPLQHTRLAEGPTRQESEFVKPSYATTAVTYREQQPQSQPIEQHSFRPEARRPQEQPTRLLLKIIPNGSPTGTGFLVPVPRPYPVEKVVEKTVHVPVEVEKKVPYPVDRLVEKQIRVPYYYPVHIERVVEKRVPYAVQRLLVQPPPYPLHLRSPVTYPIERPVAQAAAAPSLVEQPAQAIEDTEPVTESSRPPRPYRTDDTRYQQRPREPIFTGENADPGYSGDLAFEPHPNVTQFHADPYGRFPFAHDHRLLDDGKYHVAAHLPGNVRLMIVPKKFGAHHTVLLRPQTIAPSYAVLPVSFRRQIVYNLVEKDKAVKDEYVGPLPPRKAFVSQAKPLLSAKPSLYSTSVTQSPATTAGVSRRTRQPEAQYLGSFRQSKMEYGFKPPMVPSVQYDEKTASKVEN